MSGVTGRLRGVVGEAVVEELDMAAGIERGGEAARMIRRRGRRELGGDDVAHLRDHVQNPRDARRGQASAAEREQAQRGRGPAG